MSGDSAISMRVRTSNAPARSNTSGRSAVNFSSFTWQCVSIHMLFSGKEGRTGVYFLTGGKLNRFAEIKKLLSADDKVVSLAQLRPDHLSGMRQKGPHIKDQRLQSDEN